VRRDEKRAEQAKEMKAYKKAMLQAKKNSTPE